MAMIIITHDMGVVAEAADDVAVMYAGQIVEQAPVLELFDEPGAPVHRGAPGRAAAARGRGHPRGQADGHPRAARRTSSTRPRAAASPPAARTAEQDACATRAARSSARCGPATWSRSAHPASERGRAPRDGDDVSEAPRRPTSRRRRRAPRRSPTSQKYFPVRKGILWEKTVGYVKAVDGVTFVDPRGQDARPRGRVRLGEVDDRVLHPPAHPADRAARSASRGGS